MADVKMQTYLHGQWGLCHPSLRLRSMSSVQINELLFRILSLSQLYTAK